MRALLTRDLVTLIEVDEVREHAGVFLVEKPGMDALWLIIDARVSNMHFLPPPRVSLVTSVGLSRVEVALENDDEDPGELSKLAGLHLGLADVKDAFRRFKISKLYGSFFALLHVRGEEVGGPLFGMWATPGLREQKSTRTRGAVSTHVLLTRTITHRPPTEPQGYSSVYLSITFVSWERRV